MKKERKTRKEKVFTKTFGMLLCSIIMMGFVGEVSGSDSHLTFTVYATREGNVGGTTANGHVIQPHDHFVALPSGKVLCSRDGYEYEVRITYQGQSVVAPVWDVGPWNIHDNYWEAEENRDIYAFLTHGGQPGLPAHVPEAQVAYENGYNDGYGEPVPGHPDGHYITNPAGIDLADGTFWDDLGMTDNDWVTVEFLWIITDVNGLQAMNDNLDGWYELGNDINASATSGWHGGAGFVPIGDGYNYFTGHFDGKGHEITDLHINRPTTNKVGLFSYTDVGSEIKNVGLVDVNITGESYVGSLVGENDGGVIDNCYSSGSVLGTGGISGGYSVGGLVGFNYGGTITNCYSAASVNGGIGYEPNNYGNNIGGLVGVNHYQGTITNCYSTGNVIGGYGLGGLVGFNYSGTITNCYSTASVSGLGGPGVFPRRIGGLVGCHHQGTISNCYSTGNVSGRGTGIGGFIGVNDAICTNCFWDIETSGQTTSACGAGKTTAQMKQQATFTNWDFVNIWDMDEGVTYPFLICFNKILITAYSPVDLVVSDPDGLEISKQLNEIPGATYLEYDINGDGKPDDMVTVPKKLGDYSTQVVPEPNTLPTDTYSLEVTIYDQTMVLAKDVQIQDIPTQPYEFESKLCYSDFDDDNDVDLVDYAIFASHWFEQDCNYPKWCDGADLDYSGGVDFNDLVVFTENWLWPSSGMESEEGSGGSEEPSPDPNIIYRIVDLNDGNDITIDVNETITVYVRMTTISDVNVYAFDIEVDISDINFGFIDNTAYPNGTAQILAAPREEDWDYWGPGYNQEEGIILAGASMFSGPISDGNLASFQYTSNGEGNVTLILIDLISNATCKDMVIHQVDPNSQQAGGEGTSGGILEVQETQFQVEQEINIDEMVRFLEEIWLQYDEIREMISEDEWNKLIDSIKNLDVY